MKQVKHLMKYKVVTVVPTTAVEEVWSLIFKKGVHGLPVVNKKEQLIGIITEEDLLTRIYPEYSELITDINELNLKALEGSLKHLRKLKAKDVMSKTVFTTKKDASIFQALSRMLMLEVRQLPVIDEKKNIVGMISKGDLFDYIFQDYLREET